MTVVQCVNIMKAITENATYLQMMTVDKSATGDANAALAKLKKREQVGVFFNLGVNVFWICKGPI